MRVCVVGAGLFGATCARLLADHGDEVVVIDRRDHVAGFCNTPWNEEVECFIHQHGPHIFHTSKPEVWRFVNRFAEFNGFVNRVKARVKDDVLSMPINLMTMHQVYGVMTPDGARKAIDRARDNIPNPSNMEEFCLSTVGRDLYELLIEGYTSKQWGKHPTKLPSSLIKRLPIRYTWDDNYYNDRWQGVPVNGYTAMIERMLDGIPVVLGTDFSDDLMHWYGRHDRVIYTGALDELMGYEHGELEYRSLKMETAVLDCDDFQGQAQVNWTSEHIPWTRIIEHKHFQHGTENRTGKTAVTREYPMPWERGMERYYPMIGGDRSALQVYRDEVKRELPKIITGGRLGMYVYMDMDNAIAAAMKTVEGIKR